MAVTINIVTSLDDAGVRKAQRAMGNLGSSAKGFSGSMGADLVRAGTALERFGNRTIATGKTLTYGVTVPTIALGAASVVMAGKYQSAMELIHTQAGGSVADVKELSAAVLGMKGAQEGPLQLSAALYHLKSIGMDNAAAMHALRIAEEGAAVGGSALEATANAIGGAWKSGIVGAGSFGQAMGTLNAIVGAGNLRMEDLTDAMGTGIATKAKTFGVSLTSVGAALATMTAQGQPAVQSATRLSMAISLMGAPSSKAAKALSEVKLKTTDLAVALRSGGIVAAVKLLREHLEGLSKVKQAQVLSAAFGGGRLSGTIMALVQGYDALRVKQAQIVASSGKFDAAVAAQAQTAEAGWKRFTSAVQVDAIKVGNILLPMATDLVGGLGGLTDSFGNLSTGTQTTIVKLGLAAAAIGPLTMGLGYFAKIAGSGVKAVGNIQLAFSGFSRAAPLYARGIAALAQGMGALTAAGRVGGIAAFASTLTAALGPVGLTVAAIAGAGGLIYGLYRLSEAFSGASASAADFSGVTARLEGPDAAKFQAQMNKALGGHYVVKAGKLVWQPAVDVSTATIVAAVHEAAAKVRAAKAEEAKADLLRAAKIRFDELNNQAKYDAAKASMASTKTPALAAAAQATAQASRAAADQAAGVVDKLTGSLSRLQGRDHVVVIRAQIRDLQVGIRKSEAELKKLTGKKHMTAVDLKNAQGIRDKISGMRSDLTRITRAHWQVIVQAKIEAEQKKLIGFQTTLHKIGAGNTQAKIAARDTLTAAIAKCKQRLTVLNGQKTAPKVTLQDNASVGIRNISTLLSNLPSTKTITVITNTVGGGKPRARGGVDVVSSATAFVAGEAGREIAAFFPLSDPVRAAALNADLQSRLARYLPGSRTGGRAALPAISSRSAAQGSIVTHEYNINVILPGGTTLVGEAEAVGKILAPHVRRALEHSYTQSGIGRS